jgi:hypothetical protein
MNMMIVQCSRNGSHSTEKVGTLFGSVCSLLSLERQDDERFEQQLCLYWQAVCRVGPSRRVGGGYCETPYLCTFDWEFYDEFDFSLINPFQSMATNTSGQFLTPLWLILCVLGAGGVMAVAQVELERVEKGRLFVLAMPGEKTPSPSEFADAQVSARTYLLPALGFLGLLGVILTFTRPALRRLAPFKTDVLLTVFVIAFLADLASTLWFFHARGIDLELHPGVRLFAYAYGRTAGAIAGKGVQLLGVIGLGVVFPRLRTLLMIVACTLYAVAAVYNFVMLLS